MKYVRNQFWPGIDVIAPLNELTNSKNVFTSNDLFTSSSLQQTGRAPFIFSLHNVSKLLHLDSIQTLSLFSSLTICLTPIVTIYTFSLIWQKVEKSEKPIKLSVLKIIFFSLIQILYPLWIKLPGLYYAGYGPFMSPWATPEYLSTLIMGFGIIMLQKKASSTSVIFILFTFLLLTIAILIHPVAAVCFLSLWMMLKSTIDKQPKLNYLISVSSIISGAILLRMFFFLPYNQLSKKQFVQIYAQFRHPHHFWPSFYFDKTSTFLYVVSCLILGVVAARIKGIVYMRIGMMLLIYFLGSNFLQYYFVEVYPVFAVSLFGPSRANLYIMPAVCGILIGLTDVGRTDKVPNSNSDIRILKLRIGPVPLKIIQFISIVSALSLSYNYVGSDYKKLRESTRVEVSSLDLRPVDLTLVDFSKISTLGWREFAKTNIWLDDYFPFDLKAISMYRSRWIASCGYRSDGKCNEFFSKESIHELEDYLLVNNISKIVVKADDANKFESNFLVESGHFEDIVTLKVVDIEDTD